MLYNNNGPNLQSINIYIYIYIYKLNASRPKKKKEENSRLKNLHLYSELILY